MLARKFDPARAASVFPWRDTQDIRDEIDRVCPTYKGIAELRKKGDNFQYGGPRLLVDRCLTPDGMGHFTAISLPEEGVRKADSCCPHGGASSSTAWCSAEKDPLTGASATTSSCPPKTPRIWG